jgi:ATP-dependent exoDNAse (exonuclease V) beta subunit
VNGRASTEEQRSAIEATGAEVMVEAGAGSGKTGVMVDRYCRLVCDKGVPADAVLAFTFTDKAAAELRQRIRAEVGRRAEEGSEGARELLPALGEARITTIHGFCNRLLSSHPVAVGIDPRFRVIDAPEAERAAREAFDETIEAFLAGGDRDREETVAAFGIGGLREMVADAHAELRSRGAAEPRLPDPPAPDLPGALRSAAEVAARTAHELKPGSANRELVERSLGLLADPERPPTLDELAAVRTRSRAKPMAPYREAIEAALAAVAETGAGGLAYLHVRELLTLFSERFAAAKERRGGVDFEDLQILAAQLLERTEVGSAYRARLRHLLVDEFQDTNRLQLRLIEALRGPGSQLMVVGDDLQSIYGFRHADLEVFRERREEIEARPDARAIPLSGNFRSRPEVIGAVNAIGERLLGEEFRPLRVGAPPVRPEPPGRGPAVEMLLTARDGWDDGEIRLEPATDARTPANQLAEARLLAARLRELADQGVDRGAMVVLLRSFTRLDAYEDSLERAGLRPYVVGGRGYWSQQQVADVRALLATVANPLDDQSLLGALASPACAVAPDTLWLLRAAAGRGHHLWPAVERAAGLGGDGGDDADRERLQEIPETEVELLRRFAETVRDLRRRANSLSLAGLIDAAVTETGYDLAVLMRPAGEARFANVRKLMRLAADFESAEGRDLRGLLDFLAARADADVDAQAATAVEGHDGVRIMTIHSAKGLEFDVVAIPHLSRGLLPFSGTPLLTLGREPEQPRVGIQLRRLGARGIDLYSQRELTEEAQEREAGEELRLFHVAATRARERLLLSGVVRPSPSSQTPGTAVIERIVAAFEIDRERDSRVEVPAPEPRPGLDLAFGPSEIAVQVSHPSPQQARKLTAVRREPDPASDPGEGPAPLVGPLSPKDPARPLSYTAIVARGGAAPSGSDVALREGAGEGAPGGEEAVARGRAVHSLLQWSQANGWREPAAELVGRVLASAEVDAGSDLAADDLKQPLRAWLGSSLFAERVRAAESSRAEVPILVAVAGTVLRGSIDLLVERRGSPPLIVDYKTDSAEGGDLAALAARYEIQQSIYALAVAEARSAPEVELAYVFLERPEEPVLLRWGAAEIEAARRRLGSAIKRIELAPAGPKGRD